MGVRSSSQVCLQKLGLTPSESCSRTTPLSRLSSIIIRVFLKRIPPGARSVHRHDHRSGEPAVKVGLNASQHSAALHLPETALDSRLSESLFCLPGLEGAKSICEPEGCHLFPAKLKVEGLGLSRVLLSSRFA